MRKRPAVSLAQWSWLAASVALLIGAIALRQLRPALASEAASEVATLRAERETLQSVDPGQLALWRKRYAELASERWTETELSELQREIGPRWRWRETERSGDARRFRVTASEGIAWLEILAVLATLEARSNLTVEAVGIATSGTRSARSFALVEIELALRGSADGPGHTAAPVSPNLDRRARVLSPGRSAPDTAAGGRARPASPRSAVLFAARAQLEGGSVPGSARSRGRPDHPRLVRVNGNPPDEINPKLRT